MTTKTKTRVTPAERAAKVRELTDRLDDFESELDEDERDLLILSFHGYSDRNAMLIAMQHPGATDVAGFVAWRSRGRQVRKGERGIQILAPAGSRDATEATEDEAAKPGRKFFRIAYVFDVSQTDPYDANAKH